MQHRPQKQMLIGIRTTQDLQFRSSHVATTLTAHSGRTGVCRQTCELFTFAKQQPKQCSHARIAHEIFLALFQIGSMVKQFAGPFLWTWPRHQRPTSMHLVRLRSGLLTPPRRPAHFCRMNTPNCQERLHRLTQKKLSHRPLKLVLQQLQETSPVKHSTSHNDFPFSIRLLPVQPGTHFAKAWSVLLALGVAAEHSHAEHDA